MVDQHDFVPNLTRQGFRVTIWKALFSGRNGLYTLVSLILAGLYFIVALAFPSSEKTTHTLVTFLLLASASYEDIRENRIPVIILCGLFITGIIHSFLSMEKPIGWVIAAAFSALLLAVHLIKKEAVGVGDILLLGLCISSLALENILSFLFISFLLPAIYGIVLIALRRNKEGGVPMAPCITLAWLAVIFIMN